MSTSEPFVACSDCFVNEGLRLDAERLGEEDSSVCLRCAMSEGRKLSRDQLGTSNNYALRGSGGRNRPFFVSLAVIRASIGVFEGLHRPLSGGAGIRIPRLAGQAVTQPRSWTRRRRL